MCRISIVRGSDQGSGDNAHGPWPQEACCTTLMSTGVYCFRVDESSWESEVITTGIKREAGPLKSKKMGLNLCLPGDGQLASPHLVHLSGSPFPPLGAAFNF